MARPSRYYVDYEDPELIEREMKRHNRDHDAIDPADTMSWEDFTSLKAARAFHRAQNADHRYACIKERRNLVDETPESSEPWARPWTFWDSTDEIIEDSR